MSKTAHEVFQHLLGFHQKLHGIRQFDAAILRGYKDITSAFKGQYITGGTDFWESALLKHGNQSPTSRSSSTSTLLRAESKTTWRASITIVSVASCMEAICNRCSAFSVFWRRARFLQCFERK